MKTVTNHSTSNDKNHENNKPYVYQLIANRPSPFRPTISRPTVDGTDSSVDGTQPGTGKQKHCNLDRWE